MVKRQKEKQYLSATEQKAQGRSRSNNSGASNAVGIVQKSLPFKCCALTLTPFENPVCTIVEQQGQEQGNNSNNNNKYGIVFDNAALMEYVIKNKKDPVTGKKLTIASKPGIITLNIDKDTDTGEWLCPVMTKVFSDYSTKIVAILTPSKKEANVYSYEAYNELNLKPKNYIDLTTGYKFSPKNDVLILNDPTNQNFQHCVRDVSTFWHIKNARDKNKMMIGSSNSGGLDNGNVRKSVTATRVMEQLHKDRKQREENEKIKIKEDAKAAEKKILEDIKNNDPFNHYTFDINVPSENITFKIPVVDVTGVKFTTGLAAGGFTSTADNTVIAGGSKDGRHAYASKEAILQSQFNLMKSKSMKGRKGYVRLFIEIRNNNTNNDNDRMSMPSMSKNKNNNNVIVVPLLLELHCDIVPRTCTNFLGLCRRKRYDGTIFHRLISNFMIQGGGEKMKQTKNNNENTTSDSMNNNNNNRKYNPDASLWGPEPFEDEFDQRLKHDSEGILAMANSGLNTNKQQFYITFNSCSHLDRKHTVFGNIVEGMKEFNTALSKVKTDSKDRPYIKTTTTNTNSSSDGGERTTTITNNAVVVIVATEVLDDPSMDAQKKEEQRLIELHESREAIKNRKRKLVAVDNNNNSASATTTTTTITKIGKYLSCNAVQNNTMKEDEDIVATSNSNSTTVTTTTATAVGTSNSTIRGSKSLGLPAFGATTGSTATTTSKTKAKTKFGNFSSW
jgi:peptidyl-prolyl cis-trans isomerase-like protein 2